MTGICITNYEMLDRFDLASFGGVVLDESSILKNQNGKTRKAIIEACQSVPYRLSCTATPSPNDYMELGNQAEFLGVMSMTEMLAMFFVHDGGDTAKWRLKGHGKQKFWQWLATWAVCIRKPSDLGFDDSGYDLPPYMVHEHVVDSPVTDGQLFAEIATGLTDRRAAKRATLGARAQAVADVVNASDEQWLIWCHLNDEQDELLRLIPDAVGVSGSDSIDAKESRMLGFTDGTPRVLVTKPSIAGFGMNWQHCRNMAFVGLDDSYEQQYQAIRRCWRFGQQREVNVHFVTADSLGAIKANVERKEQQMLDMQDSMVSHMRELTKQQIKGAAVEKTAYTRDVDRGENWEIHLGDCVDVIGDMADDSIHYTVFSPPFASLYTYSNSDFDMGNVKDDAEFAAQFSFLVDELLRVTMPGRLLSFHCMNLPASKVRDGYIGLKDFRGELIKMFIDAGWIFHSEVCIWKDPVTAMQRTKALGLLHKQIKKDSAMSRQGIPDYLVTMRKPGDNPERVTHTDETLPVGVWQRYASPVWMDINPSRTLQYMQARESEDERHICPLQLDVIERAIDLWTNPGDLVLSPFAGIGSEGWCALKAGRRFVGAELKRSYWELACRNMKEATTRELDLFAQA
jgi:DNA modification methylase